MTPTQALNFLATLIDQKLPVVGQGHRNVQQAVMVLQAAIAPNPPKDAKKEKDKS